MEPIIVSSSAGSASPTKDIPIIFSGPMVRALLDGRKIQTRRLAWREVAATKPHDFMDADSKCWVRSAWQKVKPGDRLWVRETLSIGEGYIDYATDGEECSDLATDAACALFDRYKYADDRIGGRDVPSIHMPRWASRITLTVTATKIEPIQCITERDSRAEGILCYDATESDNAEYAYEQGGMIFATAAEAYEALWRALHGSDSWKASPEVVALTFGVHKVNIDALKVAA